MGSSSVCAEGAVETPAAGGDAISATDDFNRELLASSVQGFLLARPVRDATGTIVDFEYLNANPALKRYHGLEPEEVIGRRMLDVFPDMADHSTFSHYVKASETGEPFQFESAYITDEIHSYWIVSITPTRMGNIAITFAEISETLRIMDTLSKLSTLSSASAQADEFISSVLELGRSAFLSSHALHVEFHGESFRVKDSRGSADMDLTGLSRPRANTLFDKLSSDLAVSTNRNITPYDEASGDGMGELAFRNYIAAPIVVNDSIIGGLVFCSKTPKIRDYTGSERQLIQTLCEAVASKVKLQLAREDLERRNADLKRFSTVVSHDLKAPLRHMQLLADLLMNSVDADGESHTFATQIRKSASEAQTMITALRNFAQLGASGLQIDQVDLNALFDDCISRLRSEYIDIDNVVERNDLGHVMADHQLIGQVLLNLLTNSLKYAHKPDIKITVERSQSENAAALICVSDNGPGIDPRFSDKIFELFRRLPGSSAEGDGVGLASCRKILEALGGKIWLDETYTSGARFCFTLPNAK